MWANRKRKLPKLFLVGQMQCFGETATLHIEDGKSFFYFTLAVWLTRGGARLSRAVFLCFFFCGWITWTAREGTKHPSRSICRRHDSLGVASMCGFASALTHCGLTPAIPLRSLPGYLRNIRFFSLRSRTLCGATWQIFRPLRAAECSGFKPQPLFFCTCTPE